MSSPINGLKSLMEVLERDGLIKLGLYSSLARRHIIKFRKEYLNNNNDFSIENLRKKRTNIIHSNDKKLKSLTMFNDFFTLSDFRDMLFHVKEHSYCISDIINMLDDVGLEFCGFVGYRGYDDRKFNFTSEFDKFNLIDWDEFEKKNPDTFSGMYQFWCKRI
jgi:hypothetical protein